MSITECQKIKFDTPVDAPGSQLCGARQIIIVRHAYSHKKHFSGNLVEIDDSVFILVVEMISTVASLSLQKPPDWPRSVGFELLTRRWLRQGSSFAAHVELVMYDSSESTQQSFCVKYDKNIT